MRKVIIGLGIVVILIVVAGLLAPRLIDVNHYRPQIESKLHDRLGRDVSLGPMRLSLIPISHRKIIVRPHVRVSMLDSRPKRFREGNRRI